MSTANAIARPNIALIKYWGKANVEENIPASGSLSITLDTLSTTMRVSFGETTGEDRLFVNDEPAPELMARVSACLDHVTGKGRRRATVHSRSNFPIAAGLASSASAFAALVVAANAAAGNEVDTLTMAQQAGRASGSAARSLYGGIVELAAATSGIHVQSLREAMRHSAETSPFYHGWIAGQDADLASARHAVGVRDFAALAAVSEHNCLKMHSVMWASKPAIVYWNSATLNCMETIRQLQRRDVPVFFTIDAGPQVKAVCLPGFADEVQDALLDTEGVIDVLRSGLGDGAKLDVSRTPQEA